MNMLVRHLESVFCDDIRHEVSGKLTFVGVYSGNMLVKEFPARLPKLCVMLKIVAPRAEAFKTIRFKVMLDDDILAETPVENLQIEPRESVPFDPSRRVVSYSCLLAFSPLNIEKPCIIRVRAYDEVDTEYAAAGLIVSEQMVEKEDGYDVEEERVPS